MSHSETLKTLSLQVARAHFTLKHAVHIFNKITAFAIRAKLLVSVYVVCVTH